MMLPLNLAMDMAKRGQTQTKYATCSAKGHVSAAAQQRALAGVSILVLCTLVEDSQTR